MTIQFRIADTFTDSLARLTGEEQKAVKTTAFDLQLNPASPGMSFHKLNNVKDKNFWSVRVSSDLRIIVHKTFDNLLLCYVDHHDKAYHWAKRRKLETHPRTGAAQLVEIRETVREITVPVHVETAEKKPPLFSHITDDTLLSYGVPEEWLADVRKADEDSLLGLTDHLPAEAAEALLDLATGETPLVILQPCTDDISPFAFDHPDAQRRFRVMNNIEELERALDYPWEKWTIFLHPAQRQLVERDYGGPARVSGSAGTGKTIVALHRAVFLARQNQESRVLLTTFSEPLANALRTKLRRLIGNEPRLGERLDVHSLDTIGLRLYSLHFGQPQIASREMIRSRLSEASSQVEGHKFSLNFLQTEWEQIVDTWQLDSWEAYRNVLRLGRKTRLSEQQRRLLWTIFAHVRSRLREKNLVTIAEMYAKLAGKLAGNDQPPFDFCVVDEAQDITVPQLRFLAKLGADRPNSLFFAGDLGQRIFQLPFSWKALGVDIRGRSRTLKINYRTSHQIRMQADRLLAPELSDVDGIREERRGTISVFNGPEPLILCLKSQEEETAVVSDWLQERTVQGIAPNEIGVFVRSAGELDRACLAVEKAMLSRKVLDENLVMTIGQVSISTMHLAKGLEFRVVVVMACDDEVIPLQSRIEEVVDSADLEEIYNTERHLLYVACTRARDHLLVTGVEPCSEFLDDLRK
jgi:superfamily I DNA/RNA helicase/mRNA-degrading endonuclease RelE of RelBE toxin-antitoxin system